MLAAGTSSRLGRPKQLLELDGAPLVGHAIAAARAAGIAAPVVVTGAAAAGVATVARQAGAVAVHNPRFAEGQSTSLAAGIAAVPPDAEAAIVLLGDQPGVSPETIRALVAAFAATRAPIVAPVYGSVLGNPVLFRRDLFPDLLALTGDEGARSLIRARMAEVLRVPVGGDAPPPDIDTEDDYRAELERRRPR